MSDSESLTATASTSSSAATATLAPPVSEPTERVERVPLTVIIPTLNEADRIAQALMSVTWADEVIIVDGGSSDTTPGIARRFGARVIHTTGLTIGAQRNAGIVEARNSWILALDADEEVTPELHASLARLCASEPNGRKAYRVKSRNWHLGRELKHGPWGKDWKVRVFSRDGRFSSARVHENLEGLGSTVETLDGALIHHPYRDVCHQVTKIAQYSRWAAEDMRAKGRTGHVITLLTRPTWRFLRDYIFLSGWRDGAAGFIVAGVSAFSVFLKYAALLSAED